MVRSVVFGISDCYGIMDVCVCACVWPSCRSHEWQKLLQQWSEVPNVEYETMETVSLNHMHLYALLQLAGLILCKQCLLCVVTNSQWMQQHRDLTRKGRWTMLILQTKYSWNLIVKVSCMFLRHPHRSLKHEAFCSACGAHFKAGGTNRQKLHAHQVSGSWCASEYSEVGCEASSVDKAFRVVSVPPS